jgi:hypothetical protein
LSRLSKTKEEREAKIRVLINDLNANVLEITKTLNEIRNEIYLRSKDDPDTDLTASFNQVLDSLNITISELYIMSNFSKDRSGEYTR